MIILRPASDRRIPRTRIGHPEESAFGTTRDLSHSVVRGRGRKVPALFDFPTQPAYSRFACCSPLGVACNRERWLVNKITLSVTLCLSVFVVNASAQQNPAAPQASPAQQVPQKEPLTHRAEFFQKAAGSSVFIYGTEIDPCTPLPPGVNLLPAGSGFVSGVGKKGASTPQSWNGWRFLVTAKHVIANRNEIIIRVNAANASNFICKKLTLHTQGPEQNVIGAKPGVDLAAISLPEIEDYVATVVPSFMLIDEKKMKDWSIGVGTEVLTIGYLFSYSGQKANYPVVKFGHISMMSDESWYMNPDSKLMEQGYVLDMSSAPGLSGSPVFTHGVEIETTPLRYRELPPYVVGGRERVNACARRRASYFAGRGHHRASLQSNRIDARSRGSPQKGRRRH